MTAKEPATNETTACHDSVVTPQKPAPLSPTSPDDTPEAAAPTTTPTVDPSTPHKEGQDKGGSLLSKIILLEGIPEALNQTNNDTTTTKPFEFDDSSLDSLLSSLGSEDEFSLDESYYFTPLEERPDGRLERLKRELQLRWEYLDHIAQEVPSRHAERLRVQENQVQELKLASAVYKEEERKQKRAERRQKRRAERERARQQEQQQEATTPRKDAITEIDTPLIKQQKTPLETSEPVSPSGTAQGNQNRRNEEESRTSTPEKCFPKSLFGLTATASTPTTKQQQQQQSLLSTTKYSTQSFGSGLMEYFNFEWYNAIPALSSLVLSCLVHAALYELTLTLVLVGMQPFLQYRIFTDPEDHILEQDTRSVEDICYGVVLIMGLVVARISGLLYSYVSHAPVPGDQTNHNKRMDHTLAIWFKYTKRGRAVKGFMDVTAFYLCFVATMYFMNRFALLVDQRSTFLQDMPSHQYHLMQQQQQQQQQDTIKGPNLTMVLDEGNCPARVQDILLPMDREGAGNNIMWDIIDCDGYGYDDEEEIIIDDEEDEDEEDNEEESVTIVYEGGPEDEAYLYQHLSANAYSQFWGYGYRAALFDLPHQLMFNAALSVMAIYTLKRYFGCSFWENW